MATMPLPRNVVAVRIENVCPIRGIAQTITRTLNSMGTSGLIFSVCARRELRKHNRARHVGRATYCRAVGRTGTAEALQVQGDGIKVVPLTITALCRLRRARTFSRSFAELGVGGCFLGRTGQSMRLIQFHRCRDLLQLSDCNRAISRAADVGCHAARRGVRMPRSFNSAAIARTLVNPWDRRSSTMAICVRLDRSHGLHVCRPAYP
jgi:hypothetical protein